MVSVDSTPESELAALRAALTALIRTWDANGRAANDEVRKRRVTDTSNARLYQAKSQIYAETADALRELLDDTTPPSVSAPEFVSIEESAVVALLERVGLRPRTLHRHPDGAFTAVFPRLQTLSQEERSERLASADARIQILNTGKLPDSGEPYIDFAFQAV